MYPEERRHVEQHKKRFFVTLSVVCPFRAFITSLTRLARAWPRRPPRAGAWPRTWTR